jgi:hypothetical protein
VGSGNKAVRPTPCGVDLDLISFEKVMHTGIPIGTRGTVTLYRQMLDDSAETRYCTMVLVDPGFTT